MISIKYQCPKEWLVGEDGVLVVGVKSMDGGGACPGVSCADGRHRGPPCEGAEPNAECDDEDEEDEGEGCVVRRGCHAFVVVDDVVAVAVLDAAVAQDAFHAFRRPSPPVDPSAGDVSQAHACPVEELVVGVAAGYFADVSTRASRPVRDGARGVVARRLVDACSVSDDVGVFAVGGYTGGENPVGCVELSHPPPCVDSAEEVECAEVV